MPIRNYLEMPLAAKPVHAGNVPCPQVSVFAPAEFECPLRSLYYILLPAGGTFGHHRHGDENEVYILLEGEGEYEQDGDIRPVKTGDIMLCPPFSAHALTNTGSSDMRLVVFAVPTLPARPAPAQDAPRPAMAVRNFLELPLRQDIIHGGEGLCPHTRVFVPGDFDSPLRSLNYTILPPGARFGLHPHGNESELYTALSGSGEYTENGVTTPIREGSVMMCSPFATHAIANTGSEDLRILVFAVPNEPGLGPQS